MVCQLRKWRMEDAADLAAVIANPRILENLRDGIPYPYTEADGREFITAMLSVNEQDMFAFAITVQDRVIGSISVSRQSNIHSRTAELGIILRKNIGDEVSQQRRSNRFANMFFLIRTFFVFLRNPLHTTWLHSMCLKRLVFSTRGR